MRELQGAGQQLIVERPFLSKPFLHGVANFEERKAGELRIEVPGRLGEVVRADTFARIHHLLGDLVAPGDHDDQDPGAVERNELDALKHRGVVDRERKAHVPGGARNQMRHRRKQVVHERRLHGVAPQLLFDVHLGKGLGPAAFEQEIDECPVAEVRRHATGRGVGLMDVAVLLELRESTPHRRRGQAETAATRDHLRRDRLATVDVFAHECRQQTARPFG